MSYSSCDRLAFSMPTCGPRVFVCTVPGAKQVLSAPALACVLLRLCPLARCWLSTLPGSCVSVGATYLGNSLSLRAAVCSYLSRRKHFPEKASFCVRICSRLTDCYFTSTPIRACPLLRQSVQSCVVYNEGEADMKSPTSAKSPSVLSTSRDLIYTPPLPSVSSRAPSPRCLTPRTRPFTPSPPPRLTTHSPSSHPPSRRATHTICMRTHVRCCVRRTGGPGSGRRPSPA